MSIVRHVSGAACFVVAATIFTGPAAAASCGQLWYKRNSIYAAAGHCFESPQAISAFGPGCFPPYGKLTRSQQRRVSAILAQEYRQGCT